MISTDLSLLDDAALRMGCEYLSDLRLLSGKQRSLLARELEGVPSGKFPPSEWCDALEYLTGRRETHSDAEQAKAALIAALSADGSMNCPFKKTT